MLRPAAVCWFTCLIPGALLAQRPGFDLSGGLANQAGRAAISALWSIRLGPLSLGAGPRLSAYQGGSQVFTRRAGSTADLPDTVLLDPSVVGVNAEVVGELVLGGPVSLGANLDLLGVAVGPTRRVAGNDFQPGHGSLFQYGNRDRGSLNSEFYVRLRVSGPWEVRGGLSHYVVGYTTSSAGGQGRYQRFQTVPFVGIAYRP